MMLTETHLDAVHSETSTHRVHRMSADTVHIAGDHYGCDTWSPGLSETVHHRRHKCTHPVCQNTGQM